MIEKLLKAKHWHLFLVFFGLPFLIYIGWMIGFVTDIVNNVDSYNETYPFEIFDKIMIMVVLMMIPASVQYAWFYSMGVGLQKKLPEGMSMKVNLFKVFFFIPLIFLLFYLLGLSFLFGNIENIENWENIENIENAGYLVFGLMVFILFILFVSFCTFYQYWFIAKTIKSAELQREARFGEFVGEFFLLWFYVIGVWILQPMVNKLVKEDKALKA